MWLEKELTVAKCLEEGIFNRHGQKWPKKHLITDGAKNICVFSTVISEYNGSRKYWDYEFTLYAESCCCWEKIGLYPVVGITG